MALSDDQDHTKNENLCRTNEYGTYLLSATNVYMSRMLDKKASLSANVRILVSLCTTPRTGEALGTREPLNQAAVMEHGFHGVRRAAACRAGHRSLCSAPSLRRGSPKRRLAHAPCYAAYHAGRPCFSTLVSTMFTPLISHHSYRVAFISHHSYRTHHSYQITHIA